jgi:small subunit ribosomal protein S1
VHISELANHHVENPREVVSQGDPVNVLILEVDGERRRLSLSLKRVEEGAVPVPRADGGQSVHEMPDLRLSEEAFPTSGPAVVEELEEDVEQVEPSDAEPEAADEAPADEAPVDEAPADEAPADEVVSEAAEPEAADADGTDEAEEADEK